MNDASMPDETPVVAMCRTCQHSAGIDDAMRPGVALWCLLHSGPALRVCVDWVREPGADDE